LQGVVFAVALDVVDKSMAPGLSLAVFYVIPPAIAAWYGSGFIGAFVGLLMTSAWIEADTFDQLYDFQRPWFLVWNGAIHFAFILIVIYLLRSLRRSLDEARRLAATDPLTGLPNRRSFQLATQAELDRNQVLTMVYLDVDGFKAVNDNHGHTAGDALLTTIARELQVSMRSQDFVARLGGDEFALLLPGVTSEEGIELANRVRATLDRVMLRGGWPVSFSMGVLTVRGPGGRFDALLRHADAQMYAAKRAGKARCVAETIEANAS
jgi:diguanylate cyclase (GGDEF)-like protein